MRRSYYGAGLALCTGIGLLLRLRFLDQPMRYDEAYSFLFFVQVPLASTLSDYSLPNQHILNSLLMRAATALFGDAPWALRLPAFIFGIAIIPATFFGLRRLLGEHAALLAAACTAVSAQLVLYSTNARGYSLVVLLFMGVLAASALLQERDEQRAWIALVVCSVLGLYAIPTMLYAIGGVFIWHAARGWSLSRTGGDTLVLRRVLLSAGAVALLTLVLYLPVLVGTGLGPLIANDWVSARTPRTFAAELPVMLRELWLDWHGGWPLALVGLLIAGLIAYVLTPAARLKSGSLLAAVLLWCAALLIATLRAPFARVWLFLLPVYFAVAARGLVVALPKLLPAARRDALVLAGALAICAAGGAGVLRSGAVTTAAGPRFPDAEAVVSYLAREVRPGDGVYVRTPADAPLWYYTRRSGLSEVVLRLNYGAQRRVLVVVNEAAGQHIELLRAATPLGTAAFSAPRLLHRFPASRVYEITRIRSLP